jgi:hypothetical protein
VATDNDTPAWAKHVLEEVRRVGLRLDRPADLLELARQLERCIAAQVGSMRAAGSGWPGAVAAPCGGESLLGFIGPAGSRLTRPPRSAL